MWHWLRKNHFKHFSWHLSDRQRFFLQISFFVFVCHILLAVLCTYAYRSYHDYERFVVSSNTQHSLLVLCPLKKQVHENNVTPIKKIKPKNSGVTKVIDQQAYEQLKQLQGKVQNKQDAKVAKKLVAEEKKNVVKKQVSLKQATIASLKKQKKPEVAVVDVEDLKQEAKTEMTKKVVDKKDIKAETKQEFQLQKQEQEVKVEKKIEEKLDEKHEVKDEKIVESQVSDAHVDLQDAKFVGYEQLDSFIIQQSIQQAVKVHFKPPIGIAKDVCCELKVDINAQGKAHTVSMEKSSGIVVYDSSARSAIYKTVFPKEVWNKTIIIVLGQ